MAATSRADRCTTMKAMSLRAASSSGERLETPNVSANRATALDVTLRSGLPAARIRDRSSALRQCGLNGKPELPENLPAKSSSFRINSQTISRANSPR